MFKLYLCLSLVNDVSLFGISFSCNTFRVSSFRRDFDSRHVRLDLLAEVPSDTGLCCNLPV